MFKKLLSIGLSSLFLLHGYAAMAAEFNDVPSAYWAYTPINVLTNEKVITGYPDKTFKPENKVTREEFATMLVKALNQQSLKDCGCLPYTDMDKAMWSYGDISRINSLNLVIGYPDKTFKPQNNITKTEAMIVLANTLSGDNLSREEAQQILSIFEDKKNVREWALGSVSKSVKNDIYVKYPDPNVLSPNNQATRAEIAELLYKLRTKCALLSQYKSLGKKYTDINEVSAVQHLNIVSKTSINNEVLVRKLTAKIMKGNAIEVAFDSDFTSKNASDTTQVKLVLEKDLYTQEGTFLIPAGSVFEGTVSDYEKAKLFNRNAKVGLNLTKLTLPSGNTYKISAGVDSESGLLETGYNLKNFKKDAIVTVAASVLGTGIGALAGLDDDSADGAGIGAYSGAGAGVVAAVIVPGYDISYKSGDKIYIKFLDDIELKR